MRFITKHAGAGCYAGGPLTRAGKPWSDPNSLVPAYDSSLQILLPWPDHRPAAGFDHLPALYLPGLDGSGGADFPAPLHRRLLRAGHGVGAGHPGQSGHRVPGVQGTRAALPDRGGNALHQPAGGQEHLFVLEELRGLFFAQFQEYGAAGRDPARARPATGAGGPGHPPQHGRPA
ncbi:hypothetical protein G6F65_019324 [Rhizopus arrhizus]|nr:hypothetical protein G6F65_019324 [Rhizopus arrhizus]